MTRRLVEFYCREKACHWKTSRVRWGYQWVEERKPDPTVCPKCGGIVTAAQAREPGGRRTQEQSHGT
jgi:hypothetical protein